MLCYNAYNRHDRNKFLSFIPATLPKVAYGVNFWCYFPECIHNLSRHYRQLLEQKYFQSLVVYELPFWPTTHPKTGAEHHIHPYLDFRLGTQ
jgi:hypothetical protein